MTIDETIEMLIIESLKRQGGKTFSYNIIKWLEELKEYKSFDLETDMGNSFMSGYNRAIEEVKQLNRERILMLRRAVNSKDENPVLHETLMKSRASEIVIRGDFEIELDELVKHDIKSVECLTKDARNKAIDDFVTAIEEVCGCEANVCVHDYNIDCVKCSNFTTEYSSIVDLADEIKGESEWLIK